MRKAECFCLWEYSEEFLKCNRMRKVFFLLSVALAFASCKVKETTSQTNHTIQPMTTSKLFDPHSAATSDARVTHLHWTANVNVETHVISANATFDFKTEKGAKQISFDTKDLNILWVKVNGRKADFLLEEAKPFLGQALHVERTSTHLPPSNECLLFRLTERFHSPK